MEIPSLSNTDALIISVNPNSNTDAKNPSRPSTERKSFYPQIDYMSKDKYREELEYLKSKGFDEKMITKVYILLKPKSKEVAQLFMTPLNGIYPHQFYLSKRSSSNLCVICGKGPEMHKIKDEIRTSVFERENENSNLSLNPSKICSICDNELTEEEYEHNKLQCEHISCDECWYKYLSSRITEAKVANIKCFAYKCETDLTEEFINSKISKDDKIVQKFKEFTFKNEIMRSSNKKFCPFPGCDSFIERRNEEKYVKCKNGHKCCYICLKDWHGTAECDEELDKDFQIWKENKIIKRCPQCKFYTEKNEGCNHMTCAECQYQWCWLCEGKYTYDHYQKGKCKGNQFVKANSLAEVENIRRENKRNQHSDGNYCCSCCCIELCAETNWSCSFIAIYIGIILLFCIAPIGFIFVPLSALVAGAASSVSAGEEIGDYKEMDKKGLKNLCYTIQGLVGIITGMYLCGLLFVIVIAMYALIWVIPVTNPFFSSWLIIRAIETFPSTHRRRDDDYYDYDD